MKLDYTDLLGKRFAYNGRGPVEYDCYGLLMEVYRRLGILLPEYNSTHEASLIHQMISDGKELFVELPAPEPNCVVTLMVRPPYVTHVGVMLDEGRFLHIMEKSSVTVERIDSPIWNRRVKGFYRWTSSNS